MKIYSGTVQKGIGHAKRLGYSTLNIPFENESVSGIYAAKVTIGEKKYAAAAFVNKERNVLEAHLLDFTGEDLSGETITIELQKKIRETAQFASEKVAKQTIAKDVIAVREYFKQ